MSTISISMGIDNIPSRTIKLPQCHHNTVSAHSKTPPQLNAHAHQKRSSPPLPTPASLILTTSESSSPPSSYTTTPPSPSAAWDHGKSTPPASRASPPLALFNAINQTFFMALFYWLAGYFSRLDLSKHGHGPAGATGVTRWAFVVKRFRRLVVPSVGYTLLLQPVVEVVGSLHRSSLSGSSESLSSPCIAGILGNYYSSLRGIHGPVWFCMLLFIFDTVASVIFPCLPPHSSPSHGSSISTPQPKPPLPPLSLTLAVMVVILSSFLIRLAYPVGTSLNPLNIQPAFLPQYIIAYITGHLSASRGHRALHFFSSTFPFPPGPTPGTIYKHIS